MEITVDLSLGEAADRLSILQVKSRKILDETKRLIVERELNRFSEYLKIEMDDVSAAADFWQAVGRLYEVNQALWDTLARQRDYGGEEFVTCARDVMRLNDERYQIKCGLNEATGCTFPEQKEYK